MKVYEFIEEDYSKAIDTAEEIKELANKLIKCFDKAEENEDFRGGEMNFRRSPHMRGGRVSSKNRMTPPHLRGYVVRPEEEDWSYNERYNW